MDAYAFSSGKEKRLNIMGMLAAQANTSGTSVRSSQKHGNEEG